MCFKIIFSFSEHPAVIEMLASSNDATSDPIELVSSINRNRVFREGKDIFICSGKEIGPFHKGILLNPGEQTDHWTIEKVKK